jgi:hypothetical protein
VAGVRDACSRSNKAALLDCPARLHRRDLEQLVVLSLAARRVIGTGAAQ